MLEHAKQVGMKKMFVFQTLRTSHLGLYSIAETKTSTAI